MGIIVPKRIFWVLDHLSMRKTTCFSSQTCFGPRWGTWMQMSITFVLTVNNRMHVFSLFVIVFCIVNRSPCPQAMAVQKYLPSGLLTRAKRGGQFTTYFPFFIWNILMNMLSSNSSGIPRWQMHIISAARAHWLLVNPLVSWNCRSCPQKMQHENVCCDLLLRRMGTSISNLETEPISQPDPGNLQKSHRFSIREHPKACIRDKLWDCRSWFCSRSGQKSAKQIRISKSYTRRRPSPFHMRGVISPSYYGSPCSELPIKLSNSNNAPNLVKVEKKAFPAIRRKICS